MHRVRDARILRLRRGRWLRYEMQLQHLDHLISFALCSTRDVTYSNTSFIHLTLNFLTSNMSITPTMMHRFHQAGELPLIPTIYNLMNILHYGECGHISVASKWISKKDYANDGKRESMWWRWRFLGLEIRMDVCVCAALRLMSNGNAAKAVCPKWICNYFLWCSELC